MTLGIFFFDVVRRQRNTDHRTFGYRCAAHANCLVGDLGEDVCLRVCCESVERAALEPRGQTTGSGRALEEHSMAMRRV
jgi:hypothetical protein